MIRIALRDATQADLSRFATVYVPLFLDGRRVVREGFYLGQQDGRHVVALHGGGEVTFLRQRVPLVRFT
jgi:hypothetical protein